MGLFACDPAAAVLAPADDADVALPDGSSGPGDASAEDPDAGVDGSAPEAPLPLIDARFPAGFVVEVHALPSLRQWLVVLEPPQSIQVDSGFPRRSLHWLDERGALVRSFSAPAGYELLDASAHPSGQLSVLYASTDGYTLVRLDSSGLLLQRQLLNDPFIDTDPPALHPEAPRGPIGPHTHDTGRIASHGESVVVATRNRRYSVIAYRFDWQPGVPAFAQAWRTLVEPAVALSPVGLTGGTYDTFRQVENQFRVHLAVDPQGLAYVAINHPRFANGKLESLHQQLFGESFDNDPDFLDAYVTRVASDGTRLGTSLISTALDDELYGLRAEAEGAWALGRNELWNEQGTGHDALVAWIERASGAVEVSTLDVQRGDIAFDASSLPDGRTLVVGASNYDQNPHGASISEACDTFALVLGADGARQRLPLPNGPRHSEARAIVGRRSAELSPFVSPGGERVWIGGMLDGPGTHSADGQPELLRATGFLHGVVLPDAALPRN